MKNTNEYRVRSQNKNTHDTWYKVIYTGSDFFFCNCAWAMNGNFCKHVLKVGMVVGKNVFDEHVSPNVSSIVERPRFQVDLNEIVVPSPEIQQELPPIFDSPNGDSSYHVDLTTIRPNNAMSEANEMKFLMSSTHQTLRCLLDIKPASLDHARAFNNLVYNVGQECNKMFNCCITPSKITKQRHHTFLSPLNKKRQCRKALHPRKDAMDFQRVGRVRAKKKSMDEEMEICS